MFFKNEGGPFPEFRGDFIRSCCSSVFDFSENVFQFLHGEGLEVNWGRVIGEGCPWHVGCVSAGGVVQSLFE